MTSAKFVFYLTCLFLGEMAQVTELKSSLTVPQETDFLSANAGAELTLQCFYKINTAAKLYWYKQTLGQKPKLISTFNSYDGKGQVAKFYNEFRNNARFKLDTGSNKKNHLKISDLQISDSATYNCFSCYYNSDISDMFESITVSVKDSGLDIQPSVHQSASETIQPGGSVTLNCTVHTGTCDGEHSVYWFKDSEESHPGLIYTHGGRNDQCERKPNTQTHTCVYNLPMKSLNLSHAGTYYCAVASCGHILFGNGTKLDFEDDKDSFVLVYFLSGALAFITILSVLLAFLPYIKTTTNSNRESEARSSTTNAEGYTNEDNLHYAALRINKAGRARRQRTVAEDECVYSSVKQ